MRFPGLLAAIAISLLPLVSRGAGAPPSSDLYTFSGEVKSIDVASRTMTIKSGGKSFVFHVGPETRISSFNGHIRFDQVRPGQGAVVTMRVGDHGAGIAVKIRLSADAGGARLASMYSAKTLQGETINGVAVANYVLYEPPGDGWSTTVTYEGGLRGAMFLLLVDRAGAVTDVKPIGTLGYEDLNARAIRWLKRWKFRPNTVTEVRMPAIYTRSR